MCRPVWVAPLLGHGRGGLKGRPAGAAVVPLLNKLDLLDAEQGTPVSVQLARRLLQQTAVVSEVILGAVATSIPAAQAVGLSLIHI